MTENREILRHIDHYLFKGHSRMGGDLEAV